MIIFLDIDGVLNHMNMEWNGMYVIDKNRLQNLEKLVIELDASIVISSTWRILNEKEFFREHLGEFIFSRLEQDWCTKRLGTIRGLEVKDWLDRNLGKYKTTEYLILDDDQDFLWFQPLIHISGMNGFTEEHLEIALKSLGKRKYACTN